MKRQNDPPAKSIAPPGKVRRVRQSSKQGVRRDKSKAKSTTTPANALSEYFPVPHVPSSQTLVTTSTNFHVKGKTASTWPNLHDLKGQSSTTFGAQRSGYSLKGPPTASKSKLGGFFVPEKGTAWKSQTPAWLAREPRVYNDEILKSFIDLDESEVNICWRCSHRGPPVTVGEPSKATNIIAAILCLACLTPFMFLPYWLNCKVTPVQRCKNCGAYQTEPTRV